MGVAFIPQPEFMNPLEENWFADQNNKTLDEYTVSEEKQDNQLQTVRSETTTE